MMLARVAALLAVGAAAAIDDARVPAGADAVVPGRRRGSAGGSRVLAPRRDCGCARVGQVDYRGTANVTANGDACMSWERQGYFPEDFPDAGLEENYCRNPDFDDHRAWCDTETAWGVCNIPFCDDCAHLSTGIPCEGPSSGPCERSKEGSPRFCDFQLGPGAGGYCVECAWGESMSRMDTLTPLGIGDYEDKCLCPKPCGEGSFCAGARGCVDCLELRIVHPSLCDMFASVSDMSSAAAGKCNEACLPVACSKSLDCETQVFSDSPTYFPTMLSPLTGNNSVDEEDDSMPLGNNTVNVDASSGDIDGGQDLEDEGNGINDVDSDSKDDEGRRLNNADYVYFCNFAKPDDSNGGDERTGTCEPCAGLLSAEECDARGASPLGSRECTEVCKDVMPPSCSTNGDCKDEGQSFCNNKSHACEGCPLDHCGIGERDNASVENCVVSCGNTRCSNYTEGSVSVGSLVDIGEDKIAPSVGATYSSMFDQVSLSGALVECQSQGEVACPNAPANFVCYFPEVDWCNDISSCSLLHSLCKESGGIAIVYYAAHSSLGPGDVLVVVKDEPMITIKLSNPDGQELLKNGLGLETKVATWVKEECTIGCSDGVPCPSSTPNALYCDYNMGDYGTCKECLPDENKDEQTNECFFSGLSLYGAQDCSETCKSTLAASSCKVCGEGISADSLKSAPEGDPVCNFCPDGLKEANFEQIIPFLGDATTCYKMNQFFLSYKIAEDDPNCQLALNFNYVCGCEGPGYVRADSPAKKAALVWAPRSAAVLSLAGSSAIIADIVQSRRKRSRLRYQLLVMMSVFDLMGSAAYALTSLPIPEEYGIKGSRGSAATCSAQAFFIQMGTIASLLNVSLAAYYYCIIKLGWSESKTKEMRRWLFLCPVVAGMVFACAGIPFYGMLFTWCNNTAPWWPEIPVIIAIILATSIMASISRDVYKTEQASNQYTGGGQNSISTAVFYSSAWYLLSFYLTWLPYLALQFMWASGSGYSAYGFVVVACTMVPLQGFWNCFVYFRKDASGFLANHSSVMLSWIRSTRQSTQKAGVGTSDANALGRTSPNT